MKKLLYPFMFLIISSCTNNSNPPQVQEKQEVKETQEMEAKEVSKTASAVEAPNIIQLYSYFNSKSVKLNYDENFIFPEIKENDGKFWVYDSAIEEPVDQVDVKDSLLSFTFGDYPIKAVNLKDCSDGKIVAFIIGELAGNYISYTLKIYRGSDANNWNDITTESLNLSDLNNQFSFPNNVDSKDSYEFQIRNQELAVKINQGKLSPVHAEENPEDPILSLDKSVYEKEVVLTWSPNSCKFLIK